MIDWIAAHAGVIGLLFFFFFFVGVVLWVFRPGSKSGYQAKANIPLNDDKDEDQGHE